MEILKEEVLGKVIGGSEYTFQEHAEFFVEGLKKGLCKYNGPRSVVRGAAQIVDSITDTDSSNSSDFSEGVGTSIGGMVQIYVTCKFAHFVCKMLSKNGHVKKFFS